MPPIETVMAENEQLRGENQLLREQLAWLRQQVFGGGKSERIDAAQLRLQLEELEAKIAQTKETVTYERQRPKQGRHEVPAERFKDLPVEKTTVITPEEVKAEPEAYEQIGQEETFEVEIQPPRLYKHQIIRTKHRLKTDRSRPPVIAPAPARPIQGSYASAGLLAWVVLSKYVEHQPLYRQEKASTRWGAALSRKTMADWVEAVALWLKPIYHHMRRDLLDGGYVQADETPVRYCDPDQKKGTTGQGWLWAISRPEGEVVFDWRLSRRHEEATRLLEGYRGLLQTDGYGAYRAFSERAEVTWLGCWAHARRKFYESLKEDPKAIGLVLRLIGRLYAHEEVYRREGLDAGQRHRRRQMTHPRIHRWLKIVIRMCAHRALPKSGLGKACHYALGHWESLVAYLEHGRAELGRVGNRRGGRRSRSRSWPAAFARVPVPHALP
jgi:transposase